MPTDATGTPTSLGIRTYNTSADAPSGLGFNGAMADIDALLVQRLKLTGAPTTTGQVPIWNNGTGQWVPGSVAAGPSAPALTFPGSPTNGQQCIITDSLTAPTYEWVFMWNTAMTTPSWVFIGGSSSFTEVVTAETTASTTYVALATAGPSFTIPNLLTSWDVFVEVGFHASNTQNGSAEMSYDIGGTGAVDADAARTAVIQANGTAGAARSRRKLAVAANTALVAKYKQESSGAGTATFSNRYMRVIPLRVN